VKTCAPARQVIAAREAEGGACGAVLDQKLRVLVAKEDVCAAEIERDRLASRVRQPQRPTSAVENGRHGIVATLVTDASEDNAAASDFAQAVLHVRRRDDLRRRPSRAVYERPALLTRQAHEETLHHQPVLNAENAPL
jgi:hypothetical protein